MIGTCAIMIMLSLGIAMNRNFLEQINQMGNIMQITVYHYNQGGRPLTGRTFSLTMIWLPVWKRWTE